MKNIIFLEGLPTVGKTTLLNCLSDKYKNINIVPELINGNMPDYKLQDQNWFMQNDDKKLDLYKDGNIVIDRGPLSTLSYNQTRKITDTNFCFNIDNVIDWFQKYKELYQSDYVYVVYLTTNNLRFGITSNYVTDPYGSIENQKLLEQISLFNLQKFVKNYKIINYNFKNIGETIDEIADKFVCA